ncbi:hypothetical protein JCM10213_001939 [Rhodosporidiobolus nylandii]
MSAAPAFLAITSRPALLNVLHTLAERESQRRALGEEGRLRVPTPNGRVGRAASVATEGVTDAYGQLAGQDPPEWFSLACGTARENMGKNRYGDIIAYDRTRCLPPLRTTAAAGESSYVNASLVHEPDLGVPEKQLKRRWWVASQAPIKSTVHDFLSLLLAPPTSQAYQALSTTSASSSAPPSLPMVNLVVQLTPLVEGRRQKCEPYFPAEVGEEWEIPSASNEEGQGVWVRLEKKEEKDGARTSELVVGREGEKEGRKVVHLEYLGWRDHGVPDSAAHLIRFIRRADELSASLAPSPSSPSSPDPPALLHCSAGVGRTGTFIAISSLLPFLSLLRSTPALLQDLPLPPKPPSHPLGPYPITELLPNGTPDYVGATVDGLRDQRTTMAQTQEQTLWIYQALITAWETGLV